MGVRGLRRYLGQILGEDVLGREMVEVGDTLCVDGNAFIFAVVDELSRRRSRKNFPNQHDDLQGVAAELGGAYGVYKLCALDMIRELKSMGLNLVFFFDGKSDAFKAETMTRRKKDIGNEYLSLAEAMEEGAALPALEDMPLPPLCLWTMRSLLVEYEEHVVECQGEADPEIARYVAEGNSAGSGKFFAYGRDSDFILMKDCPYIEFGEIKVISSESGDFGEALSRKRAHALVWRRRCVAMALDLTEAQFVDLGILVGNDFSGNISRRTYFNFSRSQDDVLCIPKALEFRCDAGSIGDLVNIVRGQQSMLMARQSTGRQPAVFMDEGESSDEEEEACSNPNNHLLPSGLDLAEVIAYCRAVYNSESLDRFTLDSGAGTSDADQDDEESAFMAFDHKDDVLEYYEGMKGDVSSASDIGMIALNYLIDNQGVGGLPDIEQHHFHALGTMDLTDTGIPCEGNILWDDNTVDAYYGAIKKNKAGLDAGQEMRALTWSDFIAAYVYQKVCQVIAFADGRFAQLSPEHCFCGWAFRAQLHRYMEEHGKERGDSAPEVEGVQAEREGPSVIDTNPNSKSKPESKSKSKSKVALNSDPEQESPLEPEWDRLPIDDHQERILARIARDRVTIIHGETGCGKSSCVPRFIMEDGEKRGQLCRMMVSQPRRIAVSSLMTRLRGRLGTKVGMRMGHGVRDESNDTQITFVTTGYLVRLLAHHPESMSAYTHLIIDEVHERSVDGDMVCMMALKLLKNFPKLRVILMSATIHTALYAQYFSEADDGTYGSMECLSVGARRFPVDVYYAEDLVNLGGAKKGKDIKAGAYSRDASLFKTLASSGRELVAECEKGEKQGSGKGQASSAVSSNIVRIQYKAVHNLVRAVGTNGTGILVFVSGINDIYELNQLFEPFPRFWVLAIHSDIPYEEQKLAFQPAPANMVKVVLATNAAESSITLPDVDVVIDMGTHKALSYNAQQHKTQLINTWISKASATQRKGRTGRVRPGTVYRLYSERKYATFSEHEEAEVHRRPLEDVVLNLWVMMEDAPDFEGVVPVLDGLIEPPAMGNIKTSYMELFQSGFITEHSDDGELTPAGRLSGALPVDLRVGRLICYGLQLGIGPECIALAAALTLPRSVFRYANPIHSDPEEYIEIVRNIMHTSTIIDHGTYSEPIAVIRLLNLLLPMNSKLHQAREWARAGGLVWSVLSQLKSSAQYLAKSVADAVKRSYGTVQVEDIDLSLEQAGPLTDAKINLLRLILCWCNSSNVLEMRPPARAMDGSVPTDVTVVGGNEVTDDHFYAVFKDEVPYVLTDGGKSIYSGKLESFWTLTPTPQGGESLPDSSEHLCRNVNLALSILHEAAWEFYAKFMWVMVRDTNGVQLFVAVLQGEDGNSLENLGKRLQNYVFAGKSDRFCSYDKLDAFVDIDDPAHSMNDCDGQEHMGEFLSGYALLVAANLSKNEMKNLNAFNDFFPDSAAMGLFVPSAHEQAKLTVFNCAPPEASLEKLFSGKYSKQTISNRRQLIFPPEQYRPRLEVPFAKISMGDIPDPSPLLEDLPYGHRLLNMVQQTTGTGHKKSRHLVVTKDLEEAKAQKEGAAQKSSAAVPGSEEYHKMVQASMEGGLRKPPASRLQIGVKCISTEWFTRPDITTYPAWRDVDGGAHASACSASFEKQTVMAQAVHTGQEGVYGVCHNMMILGRGNMCLAQGITVFPPGKHWLALALLCNGASVAPLLRGGGPGQPPVVSQEKKDLCNQVADALTNDEVERVEFMPDVVAKINRIFDINPESARVGEAAFLEPVVAKASARPEGMVTLKDKKKAKKKAKEENIEEEVPATESNVSGGPKHLLSHAAPTTIPTLEAPSPDTKEATGSGTKGSTSKGKKKGKLRLSAGAMSAIKAKKILSK